MRNAPDERLQVVVMAIIVLLALFSLCAVSAVLEG